MAPGSEGEWLQDLEGFETLFGKEPPPRFKSERWTIHFWLPSDLAELEGVVDPLLLIYAGSEHLREINKKLDGLVSMAREQGRSWTEIGRALGVTKQTAWSRFSTEP